MAKTRKKGAGMTPRKVAVAPHVDVPAGPQLESPPAAPFEAPARPSDLSGAAQPEDSGAPRAPGDATPAADDRDRIAARAYELYLARGGPDGTAMEDWLAAERELRRG